MNMQTNFDEITENIGFLDDWEDRYRYLIELGQNLSPLSDEERSAKNKVHGCVSQVWLAVREEHTADGTVLLLRGDSDAMIVKGLVAVLIALYSGKTIEQIEQIDAVSILDELNLREHLTSQRSNGLVSMVERIRFEARSRINENVSGSHQA